MLDGGGGDGCELAGNWGRGLLICCMVGSKVSRVGIVLPNQLVSNVPADGVSLRWGLSGSSAGRKAAEVIGLLLTKMGGGQFQWIVRWREGESRSLELSIRHKPALAGGLGGGSEGEGVTSLLVRKWRSRGGTGSSTVTSLSASGVKGRSCLSGVRAFQK